MKKILLTILFSLILLPAAFCYYDQYGIRHYRIALDLTSPLGAISKGGAALEARRGSWSTLISYTQYWGVYAGKQAGLEYQHFLFTRTTREFFIYVKAFAGASSYDSKKLKQIGDNSNIFIDEEPYWGAGAGFGKRYNYKWFFFSWKTGIKYTVLPSDMPTEDKNMYRLFYYTGPGSYIDFNLHFGIQF